MEQLRLSDHVTELLGAPFRFAAVGPEEFDCRGLVLYLAGYYYGVQFTDPLLSGDRCCLRKRIAECFADLERIPIGDIRTGDALYWEKNEKTGRPHVAFVESNKYYVDTTEATGVRRVPMSGLDTDGLEAYRYSP